MCSTTRRIAIVGVGPGMSKSLAMWLAGCGWSIALLSRNEVNLAMIAEEVMKAQTSDIAKVVHHTVNAGDPASLKAALDWCTEQLGGKLDVLNYNAAHVSSSSIIDVTPEMLELDFRVSAIGTLVAGQWFTENARRDFIGEGEYPLFLITGGVLDKQPDVTVASLCAAKAASQTLSRLFAKVLPEQSQILVGMPLISERTVDENTGVFREGFHPDFIVQKVFAPFFAGRQNMKDNIHQWVIERTL